MSVEVDVLSSPEWVQRLSPKSPHELSKVRQLYLSLYEAITLGELVDGQQLPSSRQLSSLLGVGRNTVIAVYSQLQDEQLIDTHGRRGTRVTCDLAMESQNVDLIDPDESLFLSERSSTMRGVSRSDTVLAPGVPDSGLFPVDAWRRAMSCAAKLPTEDLGYRESALPGLQRAIARYLAIYRSLIVEPEQVIVSSSTRQSLALAAMMYANNGDEAWIESPGYPGAVDAFRMMGLNPTAMSIDSQGAIPLLSKAKKHPALIYLTPCFQYPTGAPLSAERRREILVYAGKKGSVIFEDDYDSEFRDTSQARPALASSSAQMGAVVLHAGTFSKLIFPAARIAWLVVPRSHVNRSNHCLKALGGGSNAIAQAAVAEILNNGSLAKHLQRARVVYTQRRKTLLQELEKLSLIHPPEDTGGSLSLVIRLKRPLSATLLLPELQKLELGVQFIEDLMWDKPATDTVQGLVLGLGNVSTLNIPKTVENLNIAMTNARKRSK